MQKKYRHIPTGRIAIGRSDVPSVYNVYKDDKLKEIETGIEWWHFQDSKDWEEVKEQEWYVTAYRNSTGAVFVHDSQLKDCYCLKDGVAPFYSERELKRINANLTILSVKRTSDGVEFSIGDGVKSPNWKGVNNISSFTQNGFVVLAGESPDSPELLANITKACKLFTTEDGVDIYEGDTIYSLDIYHWIFSPKKAGKFKPFNSNHPVEHWYVDDKYFYTKEAVEEYILLNKPVLSIKEVFKLMQESSFGRPEHSEIGNSLKKLAKSKIK